MQKRIKKLASFCLSAIMLLISFPAGQVAFADGTSVSYTHSVMWNSTGTPKSAVVDDCYFTYEYGTNGTYQLMAKYWSGKTLANWAQGWGWSDSVGSYPGLNNWFIGADSGNSRDGVINFHSAKSGAVTVSATDVYASGTGTQYLMIVQRRNSDYYPVYPTAGAFEWQNITSTKINVSASTTVNAGDELLFIVRAANQIVAINPTVTFTGEDGTAVADSSFTPWGGIKEGTNYQTGWYAYQNKNPYYDSPWTFMHGKDGNFSKMTNYITTNGTPNYWAAVKDYQDPAGAYIKISEQGAGINDWAVTSFKMASDGYIVGGSNVSLTLTGKSATGVTYDNGSSQEDTSNVQSNADFMVVLKNSEGKYYPVYPVAGAWQWKTISKDDSVEINFRTAYRSGDELLYIVKPEYIEPDHITNINPTEITIQPSLYFSDTVSTYPDTSEFTDFPGNYYYDENNRVQDIAMTSAVVSNDTSDAKYLPENRFFEATPRIAVTAGGRLFTTVTSGGEDEGPLNYSLALYSDDDGETWNNAFALNHTSDLVRVFDATLFSAPNGELWVFYNQSYLHSDGREGVWIVKCTNPDTENVSELNWTSPVRLCNGILVHAPTVLSSGRILMTGEVICFSDSPYNYLPDDRCNTVYELSADGLTATPIAKLTVPDRNYTEAVIVERNNGVLWFLARRAWGKEIGSAVSEDGGYTWTAVTDSGIKNPSSKFDIIRLNSGNLLLLNHYNFTVRDHITAMISRDDGATWEGFLSIDERSYASYPDVTQGADGRIYVVYDRDRYNAKEVLIASFTEEDVLAGTPSETTVLKHVFDKAMGIPDTAKYGHGGMFADSDLSGAYSINHSGSYFSYEVGNNGVFEPMNQYVENQWWKAWTYNGADPKVSSWFLSGSSEKSGAIIWHPAAAGKVTITSSQPLETDAQGRTAEFMVVQKRNNNFYPIYPTAGEFEWKTVAYTNETFPEINTTVAADDEILFIVRSENQIIKLSPQITYYKNQGTQLSDELFTAWQEVPADTSAMYLHSDMFAKSETGAATSNFVDGAYFSYEYGVDGTFYPMASRRSTDWSGSPWCWTTENESYPWVAHWNIAAAKGLDGVISWHAGADGKVTVTSASKISASAEQGSQLMILQKRNDSYYPIYPAAGEFEWKTVTTEEDLPTITADVKTGDEIVFVVRSEADGIILINPCVRFNEGAAEDDARIFMPWQKRDKIVVACVGDSITCGVGASDRSKTSYPEILQGVLGDDYYVINFGSSGATLSDATDYSYKSREYYRASMASNANMVIIMLGTNDCADSFWDNETITAAKHKESLVSLVANYKSLETNPTVVLMNFPTMYGNAEEGHSAEHQAALLQATEEAATDSGCKLIDIRTFTENHEDWFADALHPNDNGYAQIGAFVAEELKKDFAGDVNGDGVTDLRDLIRLKKYLANIKTVVSPYFANLNEDTVIDSSDLVLLRRLLLKCQDFFGGASQ